MPACQLAQAAALGAQHQGHGAAEVDVIERLLGVFAGADDADVALLQLTQRARKVGHHQVRHGLGRATGHLGHGGVQAHGMIFRGHHGMCARSIGHAQTGAQVVRVGHAVQHQHQRRALHFIQHLVQRVTRRQCVHARHHTLVACAAGLRGEGSVFAVHQLCAGIARTLDEAAHARVAPRGINVNLDDGLRRGLQPHGHGVEAEKNFGAHGVLRQTFVTDAS